MKTKMTLSYREPGSPELTNRWYAGRGSDGMALLSFVAEVTEGEEKREALVVLRLYGGEVGNLVEALRMLP